MQELTPLFERFGISTMCEVLQKEMTSELASDHSIRMYNVTTNKLSSTQHATAALYPEPVAGVDYSGLRGELPLVTIVEGVVAVDGDVCDRALIDPNTSEITRSRPMEDAGNTFEHGIIAIDPLTLSGYGQVQYSRDEAGADLIPTPPLQFLVVGIVSTTRTTTVFAHDGTTGTTTSAVTTASSFRALSRRRARKSAATSMIDSDVNIESPPEHAKYMVAVQAPRFDEKPNPEMAATEEIHEQPTTGPTTPVDNIIPGKPIPTVDNMRYNMIYDDLNFKGQVAPTSPVPFGSLDLVAGRLSPQGAVYLSLSLPDLDNFLILINQHRQSGDDKLQSPYESAVSRVAGRKDPNFGKMKGTITLSPDVLAFLDSLRDETDEYTSHWTFRTKLNTDISIPMIFAEMDIIWVLLNRLQQATKSAQLNSF